MGAVAAVAGGTGWENLRELGRDHLDVVWTIATTGRGGGSRTNVEALADLVREGLVRHVGVSNVTLEEVRSAQAIADLVCVQNRYAVGYRTGDAAEVVKHCAEQGIALVPFFAIAGQGRLKGPIAQHPSEPRQHAPD